MAVFVLGGFIIGAIFMYSVINLIRGNLSNHDAECYYAQALQHIEEGTAWWKR
jgi:hypothetical protein